MVSPNLQAQAYISKNSYRILSCLKEGPHGFVFLCTPHVQYQNLDSFYSGLPSNGVSFSTPDTSLFKVKHHFDTKTHEKVVIKVIPRNDKLARRLRESYLPGSINDGQLRSSSSQKEKHQEEQIVVEKSQKDVVTEATALEATTQEETNTQGVDEAQAATGVAGINTKEAVDGTTIQETINAHPEEASESPVHMDQELGREATQDLTGEVLEDLAKETPHHEKQRPTATTPANTSRKNLVVHDEFDSSWSGKLAFENELEARRRVERNSFASVVHYLDNFFNADWGCIVMEFMKGESLADRIEQGRFFDEKQCVEFLDDALGTLYALHKSHIGHRDLRPENFKCSGEGSDHFNLTDMSSVYIGDNDYDRDPNPLCSEVYGSPVMMAPEQLPLTNHREYNPRKADMWSLGCLVYTTVCGNVPFPLSSDAFEVLVKEGLEGFDNYEEVRSWVVRVKEDPVPFSESQWNYIGKDVKTLIALLLSKHSNDRGTAKEALTMIVEIQRRRESEAEEALQHQNSSRRAGSKKLTGFLRKSSTGQRKSGLLRGFSKSSDNANTEERIEERDGFEDFHYGGTSNPILRFFSLFRVNSRK